MEKVISKLADRSGFTLAEMMAAMAVFAIMAAIAVPNYLALQPGQRLSGGAREMLGKVRWARARAVEENTRWVVSFPDNHTLLIFNDANLNDTADAGERAETINLQVEYPDVTFTVSGNNPKFNGRGTNVNTTGTTTITLANSSGTKQVSVTPTGQVKLN